MFVWYKYVTKYNIWHKNVTEIDFDKFLDDMFTKHDSWHSNNREIIHGEKIIVGIAIRRFARKGIKNQDKIFIGKAIDYWQFLYPSPTKGRKYINFSFRNEAPAVFFWSGLNGYGIFTNEK